MIATPDGNLKPWIIYTRVAWAGSGDSLVAQEASGRAYCLSHGYSCAVIVDRGYSGLDMDRPGMKEVLALIQDEGIAGVVVSRIDRVTRALDLLYDFLALCDHHRVALVDLNQGDAHLFTASKRPPPQT